MSGILTASRIRIRFRFLEDKMITLIATISLLASAHSGLPQTNGFIEIAQETSSAILSGTSFDDLLLPFLDRSGSQVEARSIPAAILSRNNHAIDACLPENARPAGRVENRPYVGFRKPPSFEREFMWLRWSANGRRYWWSDLDPEAYLLTELTAGELRASDDAEFSRNLVEWVQANLKIPAIAGMLRGHILKSLALPSGHVLRCCTVTSPALEDLMPNDPIGARWAAGITCWSDGRVICLKFNFPTLRPPEPPSPDGHRVNPYTRSRFDPPGSP